MGKRKKYFVVKRFWDGRVLSLYETPEPESLRMEELTGYEGDMEYEHGQLVCDYFIVVLKEMALEGQGRS